MSKNIYYVYIFLDQTKEGTYNFGDGFLFNYEPVYVGKGKNNRFRNHLKGTTNNKELLERFTKIKELAGCDPVIVKAWHGLDEEEALYQERRAIKTIGTIYSTKNKGPLLNKTYSNVLEIDFPNINARTYILEHPYISTQELFIGKGRFYDFCERKRISPYDLLNGKQVDG